MVTTKQIKKLRDATGVSVMQCKKALDESRGDIEEATRILKKASSDFATKKGDRALGAGTLAAYIHATGTIGVMTEVLCETDFVAKNEDFKKLAYDIAMHISAMNPEDVKELLGQEYIKDSGKTIKNLVEEAIQKFGENIEISQFIRYSI